MAHPHVAPPLVYDTPIPMTWEEFLDWNPEGHAEWVAGEGIVYVSTSMRHMVLTAFLVGLLDRFVRIHGLGHAYGEGLPMRLPHRPSGRIPDVMVLDHESAGRMNDRWLEGPALLVVEVVSEDGPRRDYVEKRDEYERAGVAEYLIVESRPVRSGVTYLRPNSEGRYDEVQPDERGRIHSTALPGFWLDPAWLDRDPMPELDDLLAEISPDAYEAWHLARIRAIRSRGAT